MPGALTLTDHYLRLVCSCRRTLAEFRLEFENMDLVLRPISTRRLVPAGPNQKHDEFCWRMSCAGSRCKVEVVKRGDTLFTMAVSALTADRYRKMPPQAKKRGTARRYARQAVASGDVTTKEAFAVSSKPTYVCELVFGVDF